MENRKRRRKSKILFYFQILPGLESFCAYCAIGIGAIYLFQCSWFVAWLSLDQRRIEARRDGLIPCCLVHKDWNPSTHRNQDNWTRNAFTYFANLVRNKIFKVSKPLTFFVVSGFFLVSGRTRKVLTKMRNFLASTFSKSREKFSIDRKSPCPKKIIDVFSFSLFTDLGIDHYTCFGICGNMGYFTHPSTFRSSAFVACQYISSFLSCCTSGPFSTGWFNGKQASCYP